MNKKVTLAQIAEVTGYSINAVSRALNDKSDISDKAKAKIRAAADELGYVANDSARSLRSGRTNTVAVIVSDIFNPKYSRLAGEIELCMGAFGYSVIMLNSNNMEEKESAAVTTAVGKGVDGIIICPVAEDTAGMRKLLKVNIPFVVVEQFVPYKEAGYVIRDDTRGGYIAAEYLMNLRHTKILAVMGDEYKYDTQQKVDGINAALRSYGISGKIEYIACAGRKNEQITSDLRHIIENNSFTALICSDDVLALNASYLLIKSGKRIPEDISVIGFGDFQTNAVSYPMLDTITVPMKKLSVDAAEILIAKIKKEETEDKRILPMEIKTRESTAICRL